MDQLASAVMRLEAVLNKEKDEFMRDSAIQRFEFTFDLGWKALKRFLEVRHGVICNSPKDCFREGYKQGLLEYDDFWLELTDKRNETAHTYKETTAEEVYAILPKALLSFQGLLRKLRSAK